MKPAQLGAPVGYNLPPDVAGQDVPQGTEIIYPVKISLRHVCQEIGSKIPLRIPDVPEASFTPGNAAKGIDGRKGFGIRQDKFGYEYHGSDSLIKLMGHTFRQNMNFLIGHSFKMVITERPKEDARESDQRRDQQGIGEKESYFEPHDDTW
jgi:hypothetical protein